MILLEEGPGKGIRIRNDDTETGPPPPFTPADLSPELWLDASDATTITLNGATVAQWDDKSPNSRDFFQATAGNQPTYTVAGINGLNVVTFAALRFMRNAVAAAFNFLHDGTPNLIVVVAQSTAGGGQGIFGNMQGNAGNRGTWLYRGSPSAMSHYIQTGAGVTAAVNNAVAVANGGLALYSVLADPANATPANRSLVFENAGAAQANNAQANAPSAGNASFTMTVGALSFDAATVGFHFLGPIAEIVMVAGANATEANRQLLIAYEKAKWGTP